LSLPVDCRSKVLGLTFNCLVCALIGSPSQLDFDFLFLDRIGEGSKLWYGPKIQNQHSQTSSHFLRFVVTGCCDYGFCKA
jgi:hypothetical protein